MTEHRCEWPSGSKWLLPSDDTAIHCLQPQAVVQGCAVTRASDLRCYRCSPHPAAALESARRPRISAPPCRCAASEACSWRSAWDPNRPHDAVTACIPTPVRADWRYTHQPRAAPSDDTGLWRPGGLKRVAWLVCVM
ncbi:hypothetical protein BDV95DRAFT_188247 [Massariosphaeria phaeospora]|uniref:Uncharacterized protein n=1 Tax=Massariosphaeria phaeospora TaxID=100035 RepID=A0A7C8M492_9PLEO|nr:hypothetical protein BDV95DRAFT_188247 [Massariosphaeria phaeospora]